MPEKLRVEALVEDRSGAIMLEYLLKDYFKTHTDLRCGYELYLRPHKGLGQLPHQLLTEPGKHKYGLLNLLPAKLRAYSKVLDPKSSLLLVVLDADESDPIATDANLERLCKTMAPGLPHVIAVAVEEMESWLLGDWKALLKAFPHANHRLYLEYEQDSVCGTWERLAEILLGDKARHLIKAGYPAVGEYKHRWAEEISPYLRIADNRSPSLHRMVSRLDSFFLYRERAKELRNA